MKLATGTRAFYIILSIISLWACFFIPLFFPQEDIADSISCDYGFNNRVAFLIISICIVIWMIVGYKSQRIGAPLLTDKSPSDKKLFYVIALIALYGLWILLVVLPQGEMSLGSGESTYFVKYLYELESGKRGYVDFAYGYGPLMLYMPFCLHKLTGLSIVISYQLTVCLFHVLGLLCLYDILIRLNIKAIEKRILFWAIWISFFFYAGNGNIHYQLLRFVLPIWLIIYMVKIHRISNYISIVLPLSYLLVTLVSPEMGLSFFIAGLFYLSLLYYLRRDMLVLVEILIAISVVIGVLLCFPYLFDYCRAFSTGTLNFPFTFNAVLVLFILAVFLISFYLGSLSKNISANLEGITIIVMALGLLPASLGRCDHGHLLWNGLLVLPIFYVFFSSIVSNGNIKRIVLLLIFAVYMIPCIQMGSGVYVFKNNIIKLVCNNYSLFEKYTPPVMRNIIVSWKPLIYKFDKTKVEYPINLAKTDRVSMLIFDNSLDEVALFRKLNEDGIYKDIYFAQVVGSSFVIQNIVSDLSNRRIERLLLRDDWQSCIQERTEASCKQIISSLLWGVYPFQKRFNSCKVYEPLVDYVNKHYVVSQVANGWRLYIKNINE